MSPALFGLIAVLAAPLPAAAHAILMESIPPSRGTAVAGPAHIVLRFNSRIDQGRSKIELRGAGSTVVLPLAAASSPDTLASDTPLVAGDWVLRWQVLAVDGHITRGDVPFTVRAP